MEGDRKLAVVAAHLRPAQGFGGVAESTAELIAGWRAAGRRLVVAVSDGSVGRPVRQADFVRELQVPVFTYHAVGAVRWGFGPGAPGAIGRAVGAADGVYVSGIATWPATLGAYIARVLGKPYVIAVRGGLMPEHWDEIVSSRPLKQLFYRLLVFPSLRRARAVHVSSELEAEGVRAVVPEASLVIAPNAFQAPAQDPRMLQGAGCEGLQLVYLGRLSPEKGVLGFARAFARVRGANDVLTIVGPPVGEYGEEVVRLCGATPGLKYAGVAPRGEVGERIYAADALVLPSGVDGDVRENFGNVVVEALLHGRPALVTRGLAWDDLERHGVGVIFDRSLEDLAESLDRLRGTLAAADVHARCRAFASERYSVSAVSDALWRAVFGAAD